MKKLTAILIAALLAAALLPLPALALTEDTVEAAPAMTLPTETEAPASPEEEEKEAEEDEGYSFSGRMANPYLPDAYYTPRGSMEETEEVQKAARLTDRELERTLELMDELKAGKIRPYDGPSVANKTKDVELGVYPLDPEDFRGQTFFVILPTTPLSDKQLLSLISAFEELGIPFDPDSLSEMNCLRPFHTYAATRRLTEEETERMASVKALVIRGLLTEADIHAEKECRTVWTTLGAYSFYPYRSMTDDELAAFVLAQEGAWPTDPDLVEKLARDFFRDLAGMPVSAKLTDAGLSVDEYTGEAAGYSLTFEAEYPDGKGRLRKQNGKPTELFTWIGENGGKGPVIDTYNIDYYTDLSDLRYSEAPEAVSQEYAVVRAEQWLRDNLSLEENAKIVVTCYDASSYGWIRVDLICPWRDEYMNIMMYMKPDATAVKSISAQMMDYVPYEYMYPGETAPADATEGGV